MAEDTTITQLEELRLLLAPKVPSVTSRSNLYEFVNPYGNSQHFYAKSFPTLFPYGRGCPSDCHSNVHDLRLHSQKMLKRAGGPDGRRFQGCPDYYFSIYSYLMKQRIGGVAFRAQKSCLDGTSLPDNVPTLGEISQLMTYLDRKSVV